MKDLTKYNQGYEDGWIYERSRILELIKNMKLLDMPGEEKQYPRIGKNKAYAAGQLNMIIRIVDRFSE